MNQLLLDVNTIALRSMGIPWDIPIFDNPLKVNYPIWACNSASIINGNPLVGNSYTYDNKDKLETLSWGSTARSHSVQYICSS
jgi:hypothetical protein